jgi:hypothetical protein
VSGAVSGIIVGIVVGRYLLLAEHRLEERHRIQEQRDTLTRLRNRVITLARNTDWTGKVPPNAVETIPVTTVEIDTFYSTIPERDWISLVSDGDRFFSRLANVSSAVAAFRHTAKKLDDVLELKVRQGQISSVRNTI